MTSASIQPAVEEDHIRAMVHAWFRALNERAPVEEIVEFFSGEGLVVRLPDATLRSHEDVRRWWEIRSRRPTGTVEIPQAIKVHITSPIHAEVTMQVLRQARAHSTEAAKAAIVHWSLVGRRGAPRIRTYLVHPSAAVSGEAGSAVRTCSNDTEES